jgi:hypothetical protein
VERDAVAAELNKETDPCGMTTKATGSQARGPVRFAAAISGSMLCPSKCRVIIDREK